MHLHPPDQEAVAALVVSGVAQHELPARSIMSCLVVLLLLHLSLLLVHPC